MPSTYAHYRMGEELRKKLKGDAKEIIEEFPDLYFIGLHGPDILFYYRPYEKNRINTIGHGQHSKSGAEFFSYGKEIIQQKGNKRPYIAYILGVINHFGLDVACHGYIEEKIKESGISHGEIEVEFDRALLVEDGFEPIRTRLTDHIKADRNIAEVISAFYPPLTGEDVFHALKGMNFYNDLLLAPGYVKRNLLFLLLKVSGNYESMRGLVVNYQANPNCKDSSLRLMELYRKAVEDTEKLIYEYLEYLDNKNQLRQIYHMNFNTIEVEDR